MLPRPEGATADEVASAMGWQRHSVRGLFSGTTYSKATIRPLPILPSGPSQSMLGCGPNNATRLSGKDWLCSATRA
jgi:hypothetical protein